MARHRRNIKKHLWKQDDRWQFLADNIISQWLHAAINYFYFLIKVCFNVNKSKPTITVVYICKTLYNPQSRLLAYHLGSLILIHLRPTTESAAETKNSRTDSSFPPVSEF